MPVQTRSSSRAAASSPCRRRATSLAESEAPPKTHTRSIQDEHLRYSDPAPAHDESATPHRYETQPTIEVIPDSHRLKTITHAVESLSTPDRISQTPLVHRTQTPPTVILGSRGYPPLGISSPAVDEHHVIPETPPLRAISKPQTGDQDLESSPLFLPALLGRLEADEAVSESHMAHGEEIERPTTANSSWRRSGPSQKTRRAPSRRQACSNLLPSELYTHSLLLTSPSLSSETGFNMDSRDENVDDHDIDLGEASRQHRNQFATSRARANSKVRRSRPQTPHPQAPHTPRLQSRSSKARQITPKSHFSERRSLNYPYREASLEIEDDPIEVDLPLLIGHMEEPLPSIESQESTPKCREQLYIRTGKFFLKHGTDLAGLKFPPGEDAEEKRRKMLDTSYGCRDGFEDHELSVTGKHAKKGAYIEGVDALPLLYQQRKRKDEEKRRHRQVDIRRDTPRPATRRGRQSSTRSFAEQADMGIHEQLRLPVEVHDPEPEPEPVLQPLPPLRRQEAHRLPAAPQTLVAPRRQDGHRLPALSPPLISLRRQDGYRLPVVPRPPMSPTRQDSHRLPAARPILRGFEIRPGRGVTADFEKIRINRSRTRSSSAFEDDGYESYDGASDGDSVEGLDDENVHGDVVYSWED